MKNNIIIAISLYCALLVAPAFAVERDVQFTSVNFDSGVAILTNLGTSSESLAGWRFCSHNTSLVRRYSDSGGLNSITLAPGETLAIHYNNDATAANEINISTIGGNFAALEREAYGLQVYFPPISFGNGATIADHLQWSVDGIDNTTADDRSDEAEAGGLWIDQSDWISIAADSSQVDLNDLTGAVLHSPANYVVDEPPVDPPAEPTLNIPVLPLPFMIGMIAAFGLIVRYAIKQR